MISAFLQSNPLLAFPRAKCQSTGLEILLKMQTCYLGGVIKLMFA